MFQKMSSLKKLPIVQDTVKPVPLLSDEILAGVPSILFKAGSMHSFYFPITEKFIRCSFTSRRPAKYFLQTMNGSIVTEYELQPGSAVT